MKPLLLFIVVILTLFATAQRRVQLDTSIIEERSFRKNALNELRKDKAFQYENAKEPMKSWWDRFWSWFWYKVTQLLSTREGKTTLNIFLIVFGIVVIVFSVMKIMGMNKGGIFGRSSKENLAYTVSNDDIHGISFDEAIEDAIATGNYRFATRLLYLQTLKKLSDKNLIDWKINKTNSDYLREVTDKHWASMFKSLTYRFDYTWYGEMPINKEKFDVVHQQFKSFNNQL